MAITTKRRRKLQVHGREFVWWVASDDESFGVPTLSICSTDKKFLIRYALGQPEDRRHVVVLGPEFPPLTDAGGVWIRLRPPRWDDEIVTPGLVREIIEWGLDSAKIVVRVNWLGATLP